MNFLSLPSELFAVTILIYLKRIESRSFRGKKRRYTYGARSYYIKNDPHIFEMRKAYLDLRSLKFTWSHKRKDTMDLTMLFKMTKRFPIILICICSKFYLKYNYEKNMDNATVNWNLKEILKEVSKFIGNIKWNRIAAVFPV